MKKLTYLLILISSSLFAQDKWRSLSVTNVNGTNFSGTRFTTLSSNLHWDFNKKYFLTNWTGFQIQYGNQKAAWFTTQTTVNKYVGNWMVGVGTQYGLASDPGVFYIKNRNAFAITSVTYRWRFGKK
jgi:hypothetical protein